MFTNSSKFWNWLVVSSADPTQVATTVKGIVGTVIVLLAYFVHGPNFSDLPDQAYTIILDAFGVVSALITLFGLARKVWNSYFFPKVPTS